MGEDAPQPERTRWEELLSRGETLTAEDAERLERRLQLNPDNTDVRAMLLGFYSRLTPGADFERSRARGAQASRHCLWIAERAPWLPLRSPNVGVYSGEHLGVARDLWRHALRAHPRDVEVLRNVLLVAGFPLDDGDSLLDEALDRAAALFRDRPAGAMRMAVLLECTVGIPARDPSIARKALVIAFVAYRVEREPAKRLDFIWCMRGLAGSARRRDIVAILRDADAAGQRWRNASRAGHEEEAARELAVAGDLVNVAAARFDVLDVPAPETQT